MKVKIYSTPTCPYCLSTKQFFKDQAIEFQDLDVTRNEDYKKQAIEKSGQTGVPVIDIDGQIVFGFDKEKIQEILENAKKKPTKKQ